MVELLIRQPGYPDRVIGLKEGSSRIGRAEDNEIILADVGVSRRHAVITLSSDQIRVEDMGSGNGTYFHGQRIDRQIISGGDELIIDPFVLRFRLRTGDTLADSWQNESARLDIIRGETNAGRSFSIGPRGVTIGRSETRDIVITDAAASRHHCTIFPKNNRYILRDMGSANGIYINNQRVREQALENCDTIRIGNTEFRFVLGDSTKVATSPPPQPEHAAISNSLPEPAAPPSVGWEIDESFDLPEPPIRRSNILTNLIPMALGGAMAFVVLGLVTIIAGLTVFVLSDMETNELAPPTYTLSLPDGLQEEDADALTKKALGALKTRDYKNSFELFYRAQLSQKQNVSLFHASFLAGESFLISEIEPIFTAAEMKTIASKTKRDALLADARWNNSRGRKARAELLADFRDDPESMKALKLDKSERETALQVDFNKAVELTNEKALPEAIRTYKKVINESNDPKLLTDAKNGLEVARHELVMQISDAWRRGVIAQAKGEKDIATVAFSEVIVLDPKNVSVRIRLAQLKEAGD